MLPAINASLFLLGAAADSVTSAEAESLAPRIPPGWCDSSDSIRFHYKHKQSSMTFIVRVDRMGGVVETRGFAVGDGVIQRFERKAGDVVKPDALPLHVAWTEDSKEEDRTGLEDKLRNLFVSEEALKSVFSFSFSFFPLSLFMSSHPPGV